MCCLCQVPCRFSPCHHPWHLSQCQAWGALYTVIWINRFRVNRPLAEENALYPALYPEVCLDCIMFIGLPVGFASGEALESLSQTIPSPSQSPKDWLPDFSTETYFDKLFELAAMFPISCPAAPGSCLSEVCAVITTLPFGTKFGRCWCSWDNVLCLLLLPSRVVREAGRTGAQGEAGIHRFSGVFNLLPVAKKIELCAVCNLFYTEYFDLI